MDRAGAKHGFHSSHGHEEASLRVELKGSQKGSSMQGSKGF